MTWFTAGRWIQPPLSSGYWHAWQSTTAYEQLQLPEISGAMMVLDGYFVYDQKEIEQVVGFSLEKIEKEPDWFKEFFKLSESSYKNLEKTSMKVKTMELEEGWVALDKPMRELFTLWTLAYLQFDRALNKAFHDFSVKHDVKEEELAALVKPSRPARLVEQQREARELKKKILENIPESQLTNTTNVLQRIKSQTPDLYRKIEKHLKKFGYAGIHHFWGEPLSFEKILDIDLSEKIVQAEVKVPEKAKDLVDCPSIKFKNY